MQRLVDSHTHLDHFPTQEIDSIVTRAIENRVGLIISAGTTLESSEHCVNLSKIIPMVFAGVGIHPMDLTEKIGNKTYKALEALASENPKVSCISEIGLDFLPTSPAYDIQMQSFKRQINLARDLDKPIIVHSREAHPEVLKTLMQENAQSIGGVLHYYQGDLYTAQTYINMGFSISMAKPLLRINELQNVAKTIPLESIVLETDSAPQPWKKYRHRWTEPFHVIQVAEKLAELKNLSVETVIEKTTQNILKVIRLDETSLVRC